MADATEETIKAIRSAVDDAYLQRNELVALLARIYPSGVMRTTIPGWDPAWHNCVYIDTPEGQLSWHFHDREMYLFSGLPAYHREWDGHSTEEKRQRVSRLAQVLVDRPTA